jgi:hypothetical protein
MILICGLTLGFLREAQYLNGKVKGMLPTGVGKSLCPRKKRYLMAKKKKDPGHVIPWEGEAKPEQELVKALRDLFDEQNGPPLIRDEKRWQKAYDKAGEMLIKYEREV